MEALGGFVRLGVELGLQGVLELFVLSERGISLTYPGIEAHQVGMGFLMNRLVFYGSLRKRSERMRSS